MFIFSDWLVDWLTFLAFLLIYFSFPFAFAVMPLSWIMTKWERSFSKSFTTKKKHLQVTTSFFLWQLQGMYFWMKTSSVYTFLCGYLPISRTYIVCMYLAWRNLIHIYVNKINAQTGKRSCLANSPWRVFPKRQRINEENYITCAVDTAVVTVFVEVEDEWQDVSGLLAIWGEFCKRELNRTVLKHDRHVKY